FRQALAGGQTFDPRLVAAMKTLAYANESDPAGTSVGEAPGFPPGTTNRFAFLASVGAPQPGPPSSIFFPGLILLAPGMKDGQFQFLYSCEAVVYSLLSNVNHYTPLAEFVDFTCLGGGATTTFTNNLKAFTRPVLAFEAQAGVGTETQLGLNLLGTS